MLNAHVAPWAAGRTLAQVSQDREGLQDLLRVTMPPRVGAARVGAARTLITSVVEEAVKAGRLPVSHRLADIEIPAPRRNAESFVFASHAQLAAIAAGIPGRLALAVWLMRGAGLRISEALAVQLNGFRDDGRTLRVHEHITTDGTSTSPLKHRKLGEYRDVPVPGWLWALVQKHAAEFGTTGYLFPGVRDRAYVPYHSFLWVPREAVRAGLPKGYAPHQLRHSYASAMLSALVPISDLASWLDTATSTSPTARTATWCPTPGTGAGPRWRRNTQPGPERKAAP